MDWTDYIVHFLFVVSFILWVRSACISETRNIVVSRYADKLKEKDYSLEDLQRRINQLKNDVIYSQHKHLESERQKHLQFRQDVRARVTEAERKLQDIRCLLGDVCQLELKSMKGGE